MSAVRCYSLQKVADDATRIAMNVGKSTAMNRLRTELSIAQINTKSSIARENSLSSLSFFSGRSQYSRNSLSSLSFFSGRS
ncbi:hypothetical protein AYI70_g7940, partial [Smittium culicis]